MQMYILKVLKQDGKHAHCGKTKKNKEKTTKKLYFRIIKLCTKKITLFFIT